MAKLENEKKREWEFLHSEENLCAIYQLKNTEVARDLRFESMKYLMKKEQEVTKRNYNLVYIAPMKESEDLEDIYEKFNINHPKDFTGHSLSVSDVVVLNNMGGQITSHYVDSLGYKDIPEFTKEFLKEYEHITTVEDVNKVVEDFKKITEKEFHPINGKKQKDIEQLVNEYIQEKLEEYGLEVEIVDIVVSGSRCRGLERPNGSDLDIVVEYEGLEREDFLFYIFNEDAFKIDDIKVDINPITEWKTGTLETYLPDIEQHLEQVKQLKREKEERKKEFSRNKLNEKKKQIKKDDPKKKTSKKQSPKVENEVVDSEVIDKINLLEEKNIKLEDISHMTLEEMKNIDIRTVNRDDLVDIRDVKIDTSLPKEERMKSFLKQVKNPYCFKCGDVVVKMSFSDTEVTLEDCVKQYMRTR